MEVHVAGSWEDQIGQDRGEAVAAVGRIPEPHAEVFLATPPMVVAQKMVLG